MEQNSTKCSLLDGNFNSTLIKILINVVDITRVDSENRLSLDHLQYAVRGELNNALYQTLITKGKGDTVEILSRLSVDDSGYSLISDNVIQGCIKTVVDQFVSEVTDNKVIHCLMSDFVPSLLAPVYITSKPTESRLIDFRNELVDNKLIHNRTKQTTVIKAFNGHVVFNQTLGNFDSDLKLYPSSKIIWIAGKREFVSFINALKHHVKPVQQYQYHNLLKDLFEFKSDPMYDFKQLRNVHKTANPYKHQIILDIVGRLVQK